MSVLSRTWRRTMSLAGSVAAMGLLLSACGPARQTGPSGQTDTTGNQPSGPHIGGSITLDSIANFVHFDPALCYDTTSSEVVWQMYDQLVTYKKDTTQIIPMLATHWEVSDGGKTYTFHIRKGVTFWNGDKVTAQSFIDEFKRVLDPNIASPGESFLDPIVVGSTAFHNGKAKDIAGISAPDPYTLVIHLNQPEPFFLQVLAMPFYSAVDQKFIHQVGNKAFDTQKAMGSGPFEMTSYTTTTLVLKKNPHYWRTDDHGNRLPYLDKVTININKNAQLDALHFEQGQTAFLGNLTGVPSAVFPHFKTDPNLSKLLISAPQNAVTYLGLNVSMPPFNNPLVRRAVEYAINKDKIIRLLNGRGQVANQPLPPEIAGYMKSLPADVNYTYNPNKARALLRQAGVTNNSTTLYTNNEPDRVKLAQSIQADLQAVGIRASIRALDWDTFLAQNEKGNVQPMFLSGWFQDFPDASDFLNTLLNSNQRPTNNSTMYSNPQVDAWLNKAQTDPNQQERIQLYQKATVQIMRDAPWVPLYYPKVYYAVQPWVHNFWISPVLTDPLEYIWIDPGHSQG